MDKVAPNISKQRGFPLSDVYRNTNHRDYEYIYTVNWQRGSSKIEMGLLLDIHGYSSLPKTRMNLKLPSGKST